MLIEELQKQILIAMKSGDSRRRDALRFILNSLQVQAKDKRSELTAEEEIEVLTREAKKRREASESYRIANSPEREEKENYELGIIQEFLPQPLSEAEVRSIITALVAELGISSKKDIGKLMKELMPKIKGRYPGNEIQKLINEIIA